MHKESKNYRTLEMYVHLCQGHVVNKCTSAKKYGVDERSIQRDIDDIKSFLYEQSVNGGMETMKISL